VSLVAILDADKEGFLRGETALVQTVGRAARNEHGSVIMYADRITRSMRSAIDVTAARREKQTQFNLEHGIVPTTIVKSVRELLEISSNTSRRKKRGNAKLTPEEREAEIKRLEKEMSAASKMLEFEHAATLRDELIKLRGDGRK
jgi:excinuclease ABC subunit B